MAYSELDKSYIRHFIGYGAIWLQSEPRLEQAIAATQSEADGGGRPDSTTENQIKIWIYGGAGVTGTAITPGGAAQDVVTPQPASLGLLTIEQQLSVMWSFSFANKADEAVVDTYRGMVQLRQEGRRLCNAMARMLGMRGVRCDVFSAGNAVVDDDPFSYSDMSHWTRGP